MPWQLTFPHIFPGYMNKPVQAELVSLVKDCMFITTKYKIPTPPPTEQGLRDPDTSIGEADFQKIHKFLCGKNGCKLETSGDKTSKQPQKE